KNHSHKQYFPDKLNFWRNYSIHLFYKNKNIKLFFMNSFKLEKITIIYFKKNMFFSVKPH
ncbi:MULTISPECIES: hypothetical protein, partial [Acinetobacter]|uniref:hypothetical protein n=1 Tax=Acinetobacter TaxID=469 RepID=UPI00258040E2